MINGQSYRYEDIRVEFDGVEFHGVKSIKLGLTIRSLSRYWHRRQEHERRLDTRRSIGLHMGHPVRR